MVALHFDFPLALDILEEAKPGDVGEDEANVNILTNILVAFSEVSRSFKQVGPQR